MHLVLFQAIVNASTLPLSIIIVGGESSFGRIIFVYINMMVRVGKIIFLPIYSWRSGFYCHGRT